MNMAYHNRKLIPVTEAASAMRVPAGRVRQMLQDGKLPAERDAGGRLHIKGREFYQWLARQGRYRALFAYETDTAAFGEYFRAGIARVVSGCNGYESAELAGLAASLTTELVSGVMAMNEDELRVRMLDAPVTVQYEVMMERLAAEYGIADAEAFSQQAVSVYRKAVEESRKLRLSRALSEAEAETRPAHGEIL